MIKHRLQRIVVRLAQKTILPGHRHHRRHFRRIGRSLLLVEGSQVPVYPRNAPGIVILTKEIGQFEPLITGHRVVARFFLQAYLAMIRLTQQRVGHARPFGHLLFHGRMDPQCVHDCPFVDLRPEIPQQNDKVHTAKRFFQVCFHLLHRLDHKIQMEFRLDEIQCQFKIVPLYDEFMQLLKGPAGQFNTNVLSVSVPLRFPEITGNLPVLFHPRLRCQHVLLDILGAQHIAIRYHLIQPENHIFQMPCIKS